MPNPTEYEHPYRVRDSMAGFQANQSRVEFSDNNGICMWIGDLGVIMDCRFGRGTVFNKQAVLYHFDPDHRPHHDLLVKAARLQWGREMWRRNVLEPARTRRRQKKHDSKTRNLRLPEVP
jgi:hypothetical protein